uniref:Uncharacterized protein n=1 Tax=Methylophaga nitratireducenticrescens TaxID=754476 RepID=I1XI33_METNJ
MVRICIIDLTMAILATGITAIHQSASPVTVHLDWIPD